MLVYGDCKPNKARRGYEEGICRLMVREKTFGGIESLGERHISLRRDAARQDLEWWGTKL